MKTYDALFIFASSMKDDAVEAVLKDITNEVTKLHGKVVDPRRLGTRTFCRPLKKTDAGHYVRMILELEPKAVAPLQARFRLNESIFRVQIVDAPPKKAGSAPVPAERKEEVPVDGKP